MHKLVKAIRGRSSRLLREEFPWLRSRLPSLWTNSYFVATVGVRLSVIRRYVETQKRSLTNVDGSAVSGRVHRPAGTSSRSVSVARVGRCGTPGCSSAVSIAVAGRG